MHGLEPKLSPLDPMAILDEIQRLEGQLSLYLPTSEISFINARAAAGPVKVEPGLFKLFQQARQFSRQTGGAFDITVAPLMRCWGFMRGSGRQPGPAEIAEARASVGMHLVELNEKDVRDILQVLGALPVDGSPAGGAAAGGGGPAIDTERFAKLLGADWGWWRTVTINLAKLPGLVAEQPGLAPPSPPFDPLAQSQRLLEIAQSAPKGVKWKLRANIGDRVRWYELPEEVGH
jgi:hypothetical protein